MNKNVDWGERAQRFFWASGNPNVGQPRVKDNLEAFKEAKLETLRHYPIRRGRWWVLYFIRYGLISRRWVPQVAHYELRKRRGEKGSLKPYKHFLFLLEK